jgi:hypothetical protein
MLLRLAITVPQRELDFGLFWCLIPLMGLTEFDQKWREQTPMCQLMAFTHWEHEVLNRAPSTLFSAMMQVGI